MNELISINIDGKVYHVDPSKNLLETCLNLGLDLSYFCWHPALGSVGSCRQCAVIQFQDQSDTRGRLVMACTTPVSPNMIISISADQAATFRATNIEALMTNHPHDCPVCEEGGDCHLQDMTLLSEHTNRRYQGQKRTHLNQNLGPLINHEMNRCIGCYRCVRFYRDYCNDDDLNVFGSKNNIYFGRVEDGVLKSHFSGNLAEVCPTGVFTDKTYSEHYCRKWDLQSSPTVCHHCSVGCNTFTGAYKKQIRKISNRNNTAINGDFICDKGRFCYQYSHTQATTSSALIRNARLKQTETVSNQHASHTLLNWLDQAEGRVMALGSSRTSIENNLALLHLFEHYQISPNNFYADCSDQQLALQQTQLAFYQQHQLTPATLSEIETADCTLVIGEDITTTAPRLGLSLRQMVRNHGLALAAKIGITPWQDQAVRNLAQQLKSPLFILGHSPCGLDDIATEHLVLTLNQQIKMLSAIKSQLLAPTQELGIDPIAAKIANALLKAQQPLVIHGSDHTNGEIQQLINQIVVILHQHNNSTMCHFVLANANTMALSIMAQPDRGLDTFSQRIINDPPKVLLILEADLDWLVSRSMAHPLYQEAFESIEHVIVLDHLMTTTAKMTDLLLPSASAHEQQGWWLNSQGQLQLSQAAMAPIAQRQPSWLWCKTAEQESAKQFYHQLINWGAQRFPLLAGIAEADQQPNSVFKLARQSFRASGRTALYADIDVKEYPPASDQLSDYLFSMEGVAPFRQQNCDLKTTSGAYIWQPKWNSSQGSNKQSNITQDSNEHPASSGSIFQYHDRAPVTSAVVSRPPTTVATAPPQSGILLDLMPLNGFYDDNELAHYCSSVDTLIQGQRVKLNRQCAQLLGWQDQHSYFITINNHQVKLRCVIEQRCNNHVLLISRQAYLAFGLSPLNSSYPVSQLLGETHE